MSLRKPNDYVALDQADLVRLAQAGDREAFRVIMQQGNQRLFRMARGVVRDDAEAEDVLQEAYARAFAAIGGFRGEAGVQTWLTRIVLNEARDRVRRRRPTVDLDVLEQVQQQAEVIPFPNTFGGGSPEVDAARMQIRGLIERAVDDLPAPFRMVFILRDIEECSIEETAANLQLKPETVKTRLHRARRLLRQALDAQLGATMVGVFPFLGARCVRITEAVLARMEREGRLAPAGTFPAA
ncbi:RNA polymerase sigma factor [Brevundimonas pondensis]|uniref:RNA polymerase sigma factor n=1 Tax=Brevundimonas pondensis TaxID=2774189 RepID=A0ABX7SMU9_9CAUL|nr:RNA polymerase sigma factor [Brevundimonas pondensis]QTC89021.1 RNA polymerase sigma factor [Brevundimonas pondensis]